MPLFSMAARPGRVAPAPAPAWRDTFSACFSSSVQLRRAGVLPALVLCAALVACSERAPAAAPRDAKPAEPTAVGTVRMATERYAASTELPGRISPFLQAEIRPQVSGIVQKRLFTEGALVKAGQPLYQIDPASYEAVQASARAALAKAQAQARTAEVNARRSAELVKIDAISRQSAEESQAAAAQSASDVAVAKAALQTATINQDYTRIRAPIAGRTGLSSVTAGALVTANQAAPLTTVQQLDPVYVDVTQSSTELLQLRRDLAEGRFERAGSSDAARVRITLEDGSAYALPGRLQFSGLTVNPGTGAVLLRAVVPNPDGVLLPGMYVQAQLTTGVAAEALLVPQQAVARDIAGQPSVLLVNAERKVERRAIAVDRAVGSRWLVTDGLAPGDEVIVDGFQRIKVGDVVAPQPVQLAPAATASAASRAPAARTAIAAGPASPASSPTASGAAASGAATAAAGTLPPASAPSVSAPPAAR
ncbi:MAG: efflux RND transporter periplasmic adaptor subunit [Giesbergeria sp.]|nr:efflux RND transporter periplasmic adaptor subunit [Giesbergeria sp.]